eukprot:2094621-Rhodomonas_salina.1
MGFFVFFQRTDVDFVLTIPVGENLKHEFPSQPTHLCTDTDQLVCTRRQYCRTVFFCSSVPDVLAVPDDGTDIAYGAARTIGEGHAVRDNVADSEYGVMYCIVPYCTVLYRTVPYCAVLSSRRLLHSWY